MIMHICIKAYEKVLKFFFSSSFLGAERGQIRIYAQLEGGLMNDTIKITDTHVFNWMYIVQKQQSWRQCVLVSPKDNMSSPQICFRNTSSVTLWLRINA